MKTAHLCVGLGGSLWTGIILGWESVYALDYDEWRIGRLRDQQRVGWWPSAMRIDQADLTTWQPPAMDGELDLLAAGFSCRDISIAGRGAGLTGSSTGPTYAGCLRAIDAWRPKRVFFENSPNIRTKGRDQITADLVARGYGWKDGVIAASEVGAPHKRDRWFMLATRADAISVRRDARRPKRNGIEGRPEARIVGRQDFADLMRHGLQIAVQRGGISGADREAIQAAAGYCGAYHWNPPHPHVLRVVDGVANRKHRGDKGKRIAGLGDAWVPLQAATAFRILSQGTQQPTGQERKGE